MNKPAMNIDKFAEKFLDIKLPPYQTALHRALDKSSLVSIPRRDRSEFPEIMGELLKMARHDN